MTDAASGVEPRCLFDDSRRLTGANRYFDSPAVVLTPLGTAANDPSAHGRWVARVAAVCAALGWPDPQPLVHRHAHGTLLAFAAPLDSLLTATDVNEWAWEHSAGAAQESRAAGWTLVQPESGDAAVVCAIFAARAARERSHPLARLRAAARERDLPCLDDDDTLSIGAGSGSVSYPRAALPLPMDVPWQRLHDVPTVLVTGSNGKTTTTRLLAAIAAAAGLTPGCCSTAGVFVGGECVAAGDYAGPAGARAVLRHPAVQVAVLETARGGLLRRGLAMRRAAAAVITNVSADHVGEYGIASLDDIADAKLVVAHAVAGVGTLVLNAADALLMRAAARAPHAGRARQALFAQDFDHPALAALRAAGGSTCGVRDGRLLLSSGGTQRDLGDVGAMPLTLGGAARYNVENIAAAVLAAVAAGLALKAIAQALGHFGAQPSDNPGRLERWTHHGATVLVDYAHNPDGLHQLLQVARALKPQRLALLLGQAGNRDDQAIAALAQAAAAAAPDRIVIKELPLMLRGRSAGEVSALLERELLAAGLARAQLTRVPDEADAAGALLAWARPGDVIVLPIHTDSVNRWLVATLTPAGDPARRPPHSSTR